MVSTDVDVNKHSQSTTLRRHLCGKSHYQVLLDLFKTETTPLCKKNLDVCKILSPGNHYHRGQSNAMLTNALLGNTLDQKYVNSKSCAFVSCRISKSILKKTDTLEARKSQTRFH